MKKYKLLDSNCIYIIYVKLNKHTPKKYIKQALRLEIAKELNVICLSNFIIKTISVTEYFYSNIVIKNDIFPKIKNNSYTTKELVVQNIGNLLAYRDVIELFIWFEDHYCDLIIYKKQKFYFSQKVLYNQDTDINKIKHSISHLQLAHNIILDNIYIINNNNIKDKISNIIKCKVICIDEEKLLKIYKNGYDIKISDSIFSRFYNLRIFTILFTFCLIISIYLTINHLRYTNQKSDIKQTQEKISNLNRKLLLNKKPNKKNDLNNFSFDNLMILNQLLEDNNIKLESIYYKQNKITIKPTIELNITMLDKIQRLNIDVI
jgi:hypothetical protein